jgi:hypothetical protein
LKNDEKMDKESEIDKKKKRQNVKNLHVKIPKHNKILEA